MLSRHILVFFINPSHGIPDFSDFQYYVSVNCKGLEIDIEIGKHITVLVRTYLNAMIHQVVYYQKVFQSENLTASIN